MLLREKRMDVFKMFRLLDTRVELDQRGFKEMFLNINE